MYRAVSPIELSDIRKTGVFRNPAGAERKYFSFTSEGEASYAKQTFGAGLYQGPYSIVHTRISRNLIDPIDLANVDRGIDAVALPTERLFDLYRPRFFNYSPVPKK